MDRTGYLTTAQAVGLGISQSTLYRLAARGKLYRYRFEADHLTYWNEQELLKLINQPIREGVVDERPHDE